MQNKDLNEEAFLALLDNAQEEQLRGTATALTIKKGTLRKYRSYLRIVAHYTRMGTDIHRAKYKFKAVPALIEKEGIVSKAKQSPKVKCQGFVALCVSICQSISKEWWSIFLHQMCREGRDLAAFRSSLRKAMLVAGAPRWIEDLAVKEEMEGLIRFQRIQCFTRSRRISAGIPWETLQKVLNNTPQTTIFRQVVTIQYGGAFRISEVFNLRRDQVKDNGVFLLDHKGRRASNAENMFKNLGVWNGGLRALDAIKKIVEDHPSASQDVTVVPEEVLSQKQYLEMIDKLMLNVAQHLNPDEILGLRLSSHSLRSGGLQDFRKEKEEEARLLLGERASTGEPAAKVGSTETGGKGGKGKGKIARLATALFDPAQWQKTLLMSTAMIEQYSSTNADKAKKVKDYETLTVVEAPDVNMVLRYCGGWGTNDPDGLPFDDPEEEYLPLWQSRRDLTQFNLEGELSDDEDYEEDSGDDEEGKTGALGKKIAALDISTPLSPAQEEFARQKEILLGHFKRPPSRQ